MGLKKKDAGPWACVFRGLIEMGGGDCEQTGD